MTKILYPFIFAAMATAANAAGYSALAVSGSAVEEGGDFAMTRIASDASKPAKFVAYLQLNPGTFTLKGTTTGNAAVNLGAGNTGEVLADNGTPISVETRQLVRLTLDGADNSLEILPLESLGLKGSIVPDGISLDYAGRGVWRKTVTLDRELDNHDYPAHYFYFLFNNDENLAVKRHPGKPDVNMPSHGFPVENIRLNQGTYDITLDMADHTFAIDGEIDPWRVSVFGSSVANGSGATSLEGYAYLYGQQLRQRHADGLSPNPFFTSGVSIGGNSTNSLLNRYDDLLHNFSNYVIIGLSLGNEGIHDNANPEAVFNGFRDNMLTLIERMRADGKTPVVVNNYTRADYNDRDYTYIKQMNMLIHQWDVPSFNSLGAIDDGAGHWAESYIADSAHPNTRGHNEFMYAFVPSLFDALEAGKPLPERDLAKETALADGETLTLAPEGKVHPFTVCVRVKGSDAGNLLSFTHGAGSRPFTGSVAVNTDGTLTYSSPLKQPVTTIDAVMADGEWHDIALSHYFARGCTILYVDGVEAGSVDERLTLGNITFGDNTSASLPSRQFSEITFWRAGMTPEEMTAHHEGKMLKSSLEIYSPVEITGGTIANLAQSTNRITVDNSASLTGIDSDTTPFHIETGKGLATVFMPAGSNETVYSIDGRLVATVSGNPSGTPVALPAGIYIIRHRKFTIL